MKRELVVFSWVFNILMAFACGYFFFYWYAQTSLLARNYIQESPVDSRRLSTEKYHVAILLPATHRALDEIQRGFEMAIIKKYALNTVFKIYNANGSRVLLRAQIEEIAQGSFDTVFCIGAVATQLTKEVFAKKNVTIPIVFGAVADPVRIGLVSEGLNAKNILTGSAATTDYKTQLELLLLIKPETKNILLVYDPSQSSGLELDSQKISQECSILDLNLKKVEVTSVRDIQQKIPLCIEKDVDVVMILKDNTVVPAIDMLVNICERHKKTLFVSDLDSVRKGAAIGFGVKESSFGEDAAKCTAKILRDKCDVWQVPIHVTSNFRFAINKNRLTKQGIQLDKKFHKLLERVEIFSEELTFAVEREI